LFLKIKTFKKGTFIFDLLDGDLAFFPFLFSIGFVGIEEKLLNLKPFFDCGEGGGGFGGWFDEKWVLVFRVFEEERRGWD
jgi:hypothetical protein